jgi:hypothetical protein
LLAFGAAAVLDVSMLLATTVFLLPRLPPWFTWMASGSAAAVAPSYLQQQRHRATAAAAADVSEVDPFLSKLLITDHHSLIAVSLGNTSQHC